VIAQNLSAGTSTAGRPFFAMDYVSGHPITTDGDAAGLHLRARIELMDEVCRAVSYAHQRGVIHGASHVGRSWREPLKLQSHCGFSPGH
jgi:serine/threonine-protein kinase